METNLLKPQKSTLNKFTRFVIFIIFFFLIFKVIDKILTFYNLNNESTYIYFNWISLMFFLFVLLPIRKSVL
jgi:hypothetical protein